LRNDYKFLRLAANHPSAKYIVLQNLNAMVEDDKEQGDNKEVRLKRVDFEKVKAFFPSAYKESAEFKDEHQLMYDWDSKYFEHLVVFLGMDESTKNTNVLQYRNYSGVPYFAIDLTKESSVDIEKIGSRFSQGRAKFETIEDYALYAQARMYVDWNLRNTFCGGCGRRTMSINGGCKLICPPRDRGMDLGPCPTRGAVSNLSFPRTDCVVIVGVVNYAGDKTLLGRNKRYPGNMYSCLAGFLEPAESIEECVRREVWEESGVKVGRVVDHSTQPWPYPANVMIGCIAEIANETEEAHTINLGHDPELADAMWVSFEEIREQLDQTEGNGKNDSIKSKFSVPPKEAIAHTILKAIVRDGGLKGKNGNARI
jgi:NAD+ diphosphatase